MRVIRLELVGPKKEVGRLDVICDVEVLHVVFGVAGGRACGKVGGRVGYRAVQFL